MGAACCGFFAHVSRMRKDGGAMSNNPSRNIFKLGKPSYKKTAFNVGSGVESISIRMRYR